MIISDLELIIVIMNVTLKYLFIKKLKVRTVRDTKYKFNAKYARR